MYQSYTKSTDQPSPEILRVRKQTNFSLLLLKLSTISKKITKARDLRRKKKRYLSDRCHGHGCLVIANGVVEDYEVEPKKPAKRGFAKIDVVDVILSGKSNDEPSKPGPTAFEQLTDSTINKGLVYAPSYRLEPKKKFDADAVFKIIKEQVEKELKEITYNEKECQNACKRISYYIRRAVKQLSYDRYRIICQVRIVEKQNQDLETTAGFLWDGNFDGFTSYSMETQSFAAQAVVFGVYKD